MTLDAASIATDFLARVFGPVTEHAVYVCSLPNERDTPGQPGEKHLRSRDMSEIATFVTKWDRPERGLFYCVGTIRPDAIPTEKGSYRSKDNLSELHLLHADIDAKDITVTLDEAEARLRRLPLPPSLIIRSGHGLHAYWLLKESFGQGDRDRVEGALKQLADLVGGDLAVAECARIMRMPGTHNTKEGGWTEVTVALADAERRYDLVEVEDMLAELSPVIERKPAARGGVVPLASNPFLVVAARLGFRAPIDVEQRLAAMSFKGTGDAAIHQTQLSVTASLLTRGQGIEEVVGIVLEATRAAAGDFGERWNWRREEKTVRSMCEAWVRKNPNVRALPRPPEQQREEQGNGTTGAATVHDLGSARGRKSRKTNDDKTPVHVVLGTAVIETIEGRGEKLLVTAGEVWRYADGLWSCPVLDGRRWLEVEIEVGCRALGLSSTIKLINETRQWVLRHPDLYRDAVEWDQHGLIPTRSGLLDPDTGLTEAAAPEHYATWRIECEVVPDATCPWWERCLADMFADRDEDLRWRTIETLQDMLGMSLVEDKPKSLSKALVLQGGGDSGKTTVLDVMSGLLTPHPISMSLDSLGGTHGLMEFVRRAPWVLHEAFDQSRWHFSAIVKSLLTGDPVQINVKNGPIITKRFRSPVLWGTNHPPQFKEATKAIVNRLIVLQCRQTFDEDTPVGVAAEARRRGISEPSRLILDAEKPGLLNWALAGLLRARKRGFFLLTDEIVQTRAEIRSDSNLADGFIKECVSFTDAGMVSTVDFCAAFTVWWHENKGENRGSPSNEAIGKAIASLGDQRIASHRDNEHRYYLGLHLNSTGQDYWQAVASSQIAQGKASRISAGVTSVNRAIPASWGEKQAVVRMQDAFRKRPPKPPSAGRDGSSDRCGDSSLARDSSTVTRPRTQF